MGEAEFRFFTEDDYCSLRKVLDEVISGYILTYLQSPAGDDEVKSEISKNLLTSLESLTFHTVLKERGLVELVRNLSPEGMPGMTSGLDEIIEKLSFLEENSSKIRTTIPGRKSADAADFLYHMTAVNARMRSAGVVPTYPDWVNRLSENRFLFYQTGEHDLKTGVGILNRNRRQWTIALNGARWLKFCNDNAISVTERGRF